MIPPTPAPTPTHTILATKISSVLQSTNTGLLLPPSPLAAALTIPTNLNLLESLVSQTNSFSAPPPTSTSLRSLLENSSLSHSLEFQRHIEELLSQAKSVSNLVLEICSQVDSYFQDVVPSTPTSISTSTSANTNTNLIFKLKQLISQKENFVLDESMMSFYNSGALSVESAISSIEAFSPSLETTDSQIASFLDGVEKVHVVKAALVRSFDESTEAEAEAEVSESNSKNSNSFHLTMLNTLSAASSKSSTILFKHLESLPPTSYTSPLPLRGIRLLKLTSRPLWEHLLTVISKGRRGICMAETMRKVMEVGVVGESTTGGGNSNSNSSESCRFHWEVSAVGELLGLVHVAIVEEREIVENLLINDEDEKNNNNEDADKTNSQVGSLLSSILSGLPRILVGRLAKINTSLAFESSDVIQGDHDKSRERIVCLYGCIGTMLFYGGKFERIACAYESETETEKQYENLGGVVNAIEAGIAASTTTFLSSLKSHSESLRLFVKSSSSSNTGDIAAALLNDLVNTNNTSPGFGLPSTSPSHSISTILSTVITTAVILCNSVNDFDALIACVSKIDNSSPLLQSTRERMNKAVLGLVNKETNIILRKNGLGDILDVLRLENRINDENGLIELVGSTSILSSSVGLEPSTLQKVASKFYSSLFTPISPSYEGSINNPAIKSQAKKQLVQNINKSYRTIYDLVVLDPSSGYDADEMKAMFKHTPDSVLMLL